MQRVSGAARAPPLTTSKTVFLYISFCFRRYSDLLVRCFASLDRPCFAFARPRGRDRGSIDLLGAVLIGPGVAHQVGRSFLPCDISQRLRPVLVAPSITPLSQNKLSIASHSQTAQQVNILFNYQQAICCLSLLIPWTVTAIVLFSEKKIVYHSAYLINDSY